MIYSYRDDEPPRQPCFEEAERPYHDDARRVDVNFRRSKYILPMLGIKESFAQLLSAASRRA